MARTKSSQSGIQHKKIVPVSGYKKADGTKVKHIEGQHLINVS